jgi:hypothetical protein
MKTTHESTGLDDQWRRRYLPPDLNARTVAICNENDELKAEVQRLHAQQPALDPDKATAKKARALHAGAYRTMRLEAAIEDMVHDYRPQLVSWTGSRHSRAEWAQKQIHGEYVPGWRYIDNYLKTLSL